MRLGLLQDREVIDRTIAREAAEAQARKHRLEAPTVRTEAEQKAWEQETAEEKKKIKEKTKPKIRPLSEAKAIDAGANFVSESFLFLIAGSLAIFEYWRNKEKAKTRQEDVAERIGELEDTERSSKRALVDLEKEILRLRAKVGEPKPATGRILPKELWGELEEDELEEKEKSKGWLSWLPGFGAKQSPQHLRNQRTKASTFLQAESPNDPSTDRACSAASEEASTNAQQPRTPEPDAKTLTFVKPEEGSKVSSSEKPADRPTKV